MQTIVLRLVTVLLISVTFTAAAEPVQNPREHLLLDFHWRFQLGDPADAGKIFDYPEPTDLAKVRKLDLANWEKMESAQVDAAKAHLGEQLPVVQNDFDDSQWRQLDLPHDWAVELGFNEHGDRSHGFKDIDPAKGTNIGWYRRTFNLSDADLARTLTIEFDGVYRNSIAWINGHCLGRHPSGYTSFEYDIRKYARAGANTLVVRVDASRYEGWFYEGAGIYRHVWLTKRDPIHVAHWGNYVTTTVNGNSADINLETGLRNNKAETNGISLTSTLLDTNGKSLAELTTSDITLATNKTNKIQQKLTIQNPHLWSPESPYLYKLVTTVKRNAGKDIADMTETNVGIRTASFDPEKGFTLNGQPYQIKGTCNHQDHAGVGSAIPDALQCWRIARLKEMGANAYRTSHNPPTPELLDACDRLGMLVLDETRRMGSDKEALGQLTSLIERDKNHPSVFIWSICNEEFRDNIQGDDQVGAPIAKTMQELAHKLDPSRLCTVAMNGAYGSGFANVIDLMGFNYPTRGRRPISVEEAHEKFPTKPCMGTEDASTRCTRGIYCEDADGNISSRALEKGTVRDPALKAKGYVSAYDIEGTCTAEKWWNYYCERPFMSGSFVWTGFDYRGEPTPYKWPCTTSHFGVMDLCGFPKDNFYYYQSWWTDKPVLHVLPHWNWPGKEGKTIDVWVQSNADAVELRLNGESLGRKQVEPRKHLEWTVKYAPGTLLAIGLRHGQKGLEDIVETTGPAAAIQLAADRTQIDANKVDIAMITVSVKDAQGRAVPTADNEITFSIDGPARIIGVGNGDPSSHESDKAEKRKLFNGLAQVIIQSTDQPGEIHLRANSEGLKAVDLVLTARPAAPVPAVD